MKMINSVQGMGREIIPIQPHYPQISIQNFLVSECRFETNLRHQANYFEFPYYCLEDKNTGLQSFPKFGKRYRYRCGLYNLPLFHEFLQDFMHKNFQQGSD